MTRTCAKCKKPFKDGDAIRAVVISVYREIPSSVSYAMDPPSDCLSMEHVDCSAVTPG